MPVVEDSFGCVIDPQTKRKETVRRFTLSNDNGVSAQVITLGATITSIKMPDNNGTIADIVLGFNDASGYKLNQKHYIGSTIGRVCNRIGNGQFMLCGKQICLSKNMNNKHQLHGGCVAFDQMLWKVTSVGDNTVSMQLISCDGHEGYPGEVKVNATYKLSSDDCFQCKLDATTTKATPVNLTNHAYFNLGGHDSGKESLYDHSIMIKGSQIAETDSEQIPTGELKNIEGTFYDFREMANLGERLKALPVYGFDNNYFVDMHDGAVNLIAKVQSARTGRYMELSTNQPSVLLYTANNFPDPKRNQEPVIGKCGAKYEYHGSFCLETQKYPDAVNHPNFPSIILKPNEKYCHMFFLKLGVEKKE